MTIVNKEIVAEGFSTGLDIPNISLGVYIESIVKQNVQEHGDSRFLVSFDLKFYCPKHIELIKWTLKTDVSTGRSMTYIQLLTGIRSVASGLRKRGLRTGDSCVVIGTNYIELPLMSLAVWRAGGVQACLGISLQKGIIKY